MARYIIRENGSNILEGEYDNFRDAQDHAHKACELRNKHFRIIKLEEVYVTTSRSKVFADKDEDPFK